MTCIALRVPTSRSSVLPGVEGTPFTTGAHELRGHERAGGAGVLLQGAVGGPYPPLGAVLAGGVARRWPTRCLPGCLGTCRQWRRRDSRTVSRCAGALRRRTRTGGELTGLSGFTVYRSEGVSGSLVAVATLGAEAREYVDEGLRSLTEYGYAVSAFDGGGNESVQSGVSRARTEGMAVPSGVRARDGIGRIEVIWESVADEELIGYNVYRSPRPDLEFERLESVSGASYTTVARAMWTRT